MKTIFIIESILANTYVFYKILQNVIPKIKRWYIENYKIFYKDKELNFKVYKNYSYLNGIIYKNLRTLDDEDCILYFNARKDLVKKINNINDKKSNNQNNEELIKIIKVIKINEKKIGVYFLFKDQVDYLKFFIADKMVVNELA